MRGGDGPSSEKSRDLSRSWRAAEAHALLVISRCGYD
jgi:hypothetical protein